MDGIFGNDGGNRRTESMKSQLGRERQVARDLLTNDIDGERRFVSETEWSALRVN